MSRAKREMDAKQNRAKRGAKPHNPFKKNKWVRMILITLTHHIFAPIFVLNEFCATRRIQFL